MQYTLLYLIHLTSTTASVLQSMGIEMGTVGGGIWIYTEADCGQHTNTDLSDIDTFEMLYNRLGSPGNTTLSWLVVMRLSWQLSCHYRISMRASIQHLGSLQALVNSAWATPTIVFLENLGVFPIGQLGARGREAPLRVSESSK